MTSRDAKNYIENEQKIQKLTRPRILHNTSLLSLYVGIRIAHPAWVFSMRNFLPTPMSPPILSLSRPKMHRVLAVSHPCRRREWSVSIGHDVMCAIRTPMLLMWTNYFYFYPVAAVFAKIIGILSIMHYRHMALFPRSVFI